MPEQFIGGLRLSNPVWFSGGTSTSWPLASLTLDEEGITLASRGSGHWFFGGKWFDGGEPVKIPYAELVRVELLRRRRGIRFHTQSPEDRGRVWDRRSGAIFWTWQMPAVQSALEAHGIQFK
jgi:hypothetical protein